MDAKTLAQINGEYVMPEDAGPAWRAAHAAGVDMSLIEASLRLTPEERLVEHQQVTNFLLEVQEAGRRQRGKLELVIFRPAYAMKIPCGEQEGHDGGMGRFNHE